MLGNVFSPWYAAARRGGPAEPLDFPALNVVIYGPRGAGWVLTERTRAAVARSAEELAIGPNLVRWEGGSLVVDVDERTAPFGRRVRGSVRVRPDFLHGEPVALDAAGRHAWWPIAPRSRVEVRLERPELSFTASGYLDANAGREPLERAFTSWSWSRSHAPSRTALAYAVERVDGSSHVVDRAFDDRGRVLAPRELERTALPSTRWRMARPHHDDRGATTRVARTLEDTPFYARTELVTEGPAGPTSAFHETLSLERFVSPWVQRMLPYRMRRERAS